MSDVRRAAERSLSPFSLSQPRPRRNPSLVHANKARNEKADSGRAQQQRSGARRAERDAPDGLHSGGGQPRSCESKVLTRSVFVDTHAPRLLPGLKQTRCSFQDSQTILASCEVPRIQSMSAKVLDRVKGSQFFAHLLWCEEELKRLACHPYP